MNKERLEALATHLDQIAADTPMLEEKECPGFSMNWWFARQSFDYRYKRCDTVCCIAGHAVWLFADICGSQDAPISIKAREILELDRGTAEKLFFNYYDVVTPSQAAEAVRRVISGNKPIWEYGE